MEDVYNGSILSRIIGGILPFVGLVALIALCSGDVCSALAAGGTCMGLMVASYHFSGGALNPALHDIDELDRLSSLDGGSGEGDRMRMAVCIIRLGLLMAAADGTIEPAEVQAIRDFFSRHGADAAFMDWVEHNLVNATRHVDPERTYAEVNRTASRPEKELLLLVLLSIALADGNLDEKEVYVFIAAAIHLGLTPEEARGLLEGFLGIEQQDDALVSAWGVLGLEPESDREAVRTAYRRLARQYHPDKVTHLGPEFASLARERMQAINDAHDRIQTHLRGA